MAGMEGCWVASSAGARRPRARGGGCQAALRGRRASGRGQRGGRGWGTHSQSTRDIDEALMLGGDWGFFAMGWFLGGSEVWACGWRVVGSAAGRALRGVRDACALERAGDPRSSRHSQDERADPAAGPSACGGGGRGTSMGAQHPPPSLSRPRPRPRSRELACPIATGVPRTTPREQPAANPGSRAPP